MHFNWRSASASVVFPSCDLFLLFTVVTLNYAIAAIVSSLLQSWKRKRKKKKGKEDNPFVKFPRVER